MDSACGPTKEQATGRSSPPTTIKEMPGASASFDRYVQGIRYDRKRLKFHPFQNAARLLPWSFLNQG